MKGSDGNHSKVELKISTVGLKVNGSSFDITFYLKKNCPRGKNYMLNLNHHRIGSFRVIKITLEYSNLDHWSWFKK